MKKELKKWLATAIDGGCSNAYAVLLNNDEQILPIINEKITIRELIPILSSLSDKWEKEIIKVIS